MFQLFVLSPSRRSRSIHPSTSSGGGGGGGLEMYFIFYGAALQGTERTRKTREKRQPEEKKTKEFIHKPFV
jgi:hypothetical protein